MDLCFFELQGSQACRFSHEFSHVKSSVDLSQPKLLKSQLSEYRDVAGIYFWVLSHQDCLYKVYIGKAKSLAVRVSNYMAKFQPRAPDDFKMRIFQDFAEEIFPGSTLSLYIKRCDNDPEQLRCAEQKAIDSFRPLLIQRAKSNHEERSRIEDAYVAYYRKAFRTRLTRSSTTKPSNVS